MPKISRIKQAKPAILAHFDGSSQKVFRYSDLQRELAGKRTTWKLPLTLGFGKFVQFLLEEGRLRMLEFSFPYRPEARYVWGDVSLLQVAVTLRPQCYLSHYTAMRIHGLTEQIPKTMYVNAEQTPKPRSAGRLEQNRIDLAFRSPMRKTSLVAQVDDVRVCLLNGMHTGELGVIRQDTVDDYQLSAQGLRVTGLERTLIDIAVRPAYAGGVFEVLKAYRNARGAVTISQLVKMIRELNYVYPYHQAIGFYLERAGYSSKECSLLAQFPQEFDFYLTHQMREKGYSDRWRLFFPKGF